MLGRWGRSALLGGLVAGACAPARVVTFAPLAEADAARVKNVHQAGQSSLCQGCHVQGAAAPALRSEPIALCKGCHQQAHGNHPVGVAMKRPAGGLPLWKGQITCSTCHDPHAIQLQRGLRAQDAALCLACHAKH